MKLLCLILSLLSAFVLAETEDSGGIEVKREKPVKREPRVKLSEKEKDEKTAGRRAKLDKRELKKKTKIAKMSGVISRYSSSEYVIENYDSFGKAKQFTLAKKWEQKKNAKAKKDAKIAAQQQQIAKFKAEFTGRGESFASDYFDGDLDKVERKMWNFAKTYQKKQVKIFKNLMRVYGNDTKAYKKKLRQIKTNNFTSFKKGKVFTREMRDERKQQKKYDVNSSKWTEHENAWKELKRQRAEVLATFEKDKKALPMPTKPVMYEVSYKPRARKAGKEHKGSDKADRVKKSLEAKEKKKAEERKKKD